MRYLILLSGEQINGKLQASPEGRISAILPNYTRVFPEKEGIENKDASLNVYVIEPPADKINIIVEDTVKVHRLWAGVKDRRDDPSEFITCPIASLVPLK